MQIRHVIIKVYEQDKALSFYTSIVGFVKRLDLPIGRVRWLTVYSREGATGVQLVLEPNNFAPALTSQKALYDASFPAAVLTPTDIGNKFQSASLSYSKRRAASNELRSVPRFVYHPSKATVSLVLRF